MIWAGYGLGQFSTLLSMAKQQAAPITTTTASAAPRTTGFTFAAAKPLVTPTTMFQVAQKVAALPPTQPFTPTGRRAPPSPPAPDPRTMSTLLNMFAGGAPMPNTGYSPDKPKMTPINMGTTFRSGVKPASPTAPRLVPTPSPATHLQAAEAAMQESRGTGGGEVAPEIKQACRAAGGTWAVDGCELPDGSKMGVGPDGQPYCMNQIGQCAGQPVAKPGMGKMALIGGAALAALMLLR